MTVVPPEALPTEIPIELDPRGLPEITIPDWLPHFDPVVNYSGQYQFPVWEDVWHAAKKLFDSSPGMADVEKAIQIQGIQQIVDATIGSTIKAMSGFIDLAVVQEIVDVQNIEARIGATQSAMAFLNNANALAIDNIANQIEFLVKVAVPELRAEIAQAKTDAINVAAFDSAATKVWAMQNILTPLEENLGKVQTETKTYTDTKALEAVVHSHNELGAAVAILSPAVVAATAAAKVATDFVDGCGEDMCNTMGPKTDLGKLLKALKVAEWAALLAELAAIRAGGLDGLLSDIEGWARSAISDFESMFFTGGKTLGETLAAQI